MKWFRFRQEIVASGFWMHPSMVPYLDPTELSLICKNPNGSVDGNETLPQRTPFSVLLFPSALQSGQHCLDSQPVTQFSISESQDWVEITSTTSYLRTITMALCMLNSTIRSDSVLDILTSNLKDQGLLMR